MPEIRESDVKSTVDKLLEVARAQGLTIIEAPAGTMEADANKVGKPVDPKGLPRDVQEAVQAATQQMDDTFTARRYEQIKAAKVAEESDIAKLAPEKQAEVIKSMLSMVADDAAAKAQVMKIADAMGIRVDETRPAPAAQLPEPAKPTPPEAAKPVEPVSAAGQTIHRCPNCTWPIAVDPIEVTDDDKTRWLRSILGGTPFVKEYPLMGGMFKLVFRTRTVATNVKIYDQLAREIKEGKIVSSELSTGISLYNFRARKLQFAASIKSASGLAVDLPEVPGKEDMLKLPLQPEVKAMVEKRFAAGDHAVAIWHDALFSVWTEHTYMMAFKEFETFERTCLRLVEASNCPDFWQGIAAAV